MKKNIQRLLLALLILMLSAVYICGNILYRGYQENIAADNIQRLKPPVDTAESLMDFEALHTQGPDIIAWLTVEGTVIDYPVLQGGDNAYYLRRDIKKQPNKNGALFLDYRVRADFSDFNNVIYGHHMRSGKMFQNLVKYKDRAFFDRHKTGYLYTPGRSWRLEIFAAAVTDQNSAFYRYAFLSPAEKDAHLHMLKSTALFYRDIGVTAEDVLLTLSTCSYEFEDARTVVLARLV
ncbi:MAG: class B sortase [Oscillospiraceae bacterium]|nr:class B sortase [Oscillospiraceae bacterium]